MTLKISVEDQLSIQFVLGIPGDRGFNAKDKRGININNCPLKNFLKKNRNKIISELDIFYLDNKNNKKFTITGTNGKSTTCKLLHDVLVKNNYDVRLVGNIGNPILLEQNIKPETIPSDFSTNLAPASEVPPVAIKSSTITTLSFSFIESL